MVNSVTPKNRIGRKIMELNTGDIAYYIHTVDAMKTFIKLCEGKGVVNTQDMLEFYEMYNKHCFSFYKVYDKLVWSCDSLENYIEWRYTIVMPFRQRTE